MPTPNADKAPDPMVPSSSHDPRFSPDAGMDAFIDIPLAPPTILAMKQADPYCTIGTAGDETGIAADLIAEDHGDD